jgi:hypothetical protein
MEEIDKDYDEDFLNTRFDQRLDNMRDLAYPDIVLTGIIVEQSLAEYEMRITGVKGPFLTGTLEEEPEEDIGIHMDDPLWALPYLYDGECHLYAMYAGENLSDDEMNRRDQIIQEMNRYGITFNGISLRN